VELLREDVLQLSVQVHPDADKPEETDNKYGQELFCKIISQRLAVVVMFMSHE
jgi:hypothetical protein